MSRWYWFPRAQNSLTVFIGAAFLHRSQKILSYLLDFDYEDLLGAYLINEPMQFKIPKGCEAQFESARPAESFCSWLERRQDLINKEILEKVVALLKRRDVQLMSSAEQREQLKRFLRQRACDLDVQVDLESR